MTILTKHIELNGPFSERDLQRIKIQDDKMNLKYDRALDHIKKCLSNNIDKGFKGTKLYPIRNKHVWVQLKQHCLEVDYYDKVDIEYVCQETQRRYKVTDIIPSFASRCCQECDTKLTFDKTVCSAESIRVIYK